MCLRGPRGIFLDSVGGYPSSGLSHCEWIFPSLGARAEGPVAGTSVQSMPPDAQVLFLGWLVLMSSLCHISMEHESRVWKCSVLWNPRLRMKLWWARSTRSRYVQRKRWFTSHRLCTHIIWRSLLGSSELWFEHHKEPNPLSPFLCDAGVFIPNARRTRSWRAPTGASLHTNNSR